MKNLIVKSSKLFMSPEPRGVKTLAFVAVKGERSEFIEGDSRRPLTAWITPILEPG